MTYVHIWWYVTRASAVVAWVLLTLAVVWGTLLSTRVLRKVDNPSWLLDLHRYLSTLSIVMVLVHLGSLMLDGWLHFSAADILIPLHADYRALPVAIGIIAFYLLVAVQLSSLLMNRIPRRVWKAIHYSSYLVVVLVSFHAGWSGTDVGTIWYRATAISLIVLAAAAVMTRVVVGRRGAAASRVERPQRPRQTGEPGTLAQPEARSALGPHPMVVGFVVQLAQRVLGIRLVSVTGEQLPAWRPGSHITLTLPSGLQRQYSLCGDPAERSFFDIAVRLGEDPTGGSSWLHANAHPGLPLRVTGPFNHFELEPAHSYLFIAGGIGITPIRAMIESLPARRDWRLVHVGSSRRTLALSSDLERRHPGRVWIHASDENSARLDLARLIAGSPGDIYCCGPEGLMSAVAALAPPERLHLERFAPVERVAVGDQRAIDVSCRKSGVSFSVGPGDSILDRLEQYGLPVAGSCRKGVCGTCEVRVVGGRPDHLDSVVADEEKDRLGIMYPCVSRALSADLVLDL
ncbi:MAG: 2Fe-2S iron-sulfur cluster-binding protein [Actinomycetota bacterium]